MTSQAIRRAARLLVVAVIIGVSACRGGCMRSAALAELEKASGTVDRDHAARLYAWSKADIGAEFFEGDGIKTGSGASAIVRLDDGSRAALTADTIVRFLSTAPGSGEHGLDVVSGEATLEVGADGLKLRTSVGLASLESNARVRLGKTTRGVRFEVLVGRAQVDTADGLRSVTPGTSVEIGVGQAVIEPGASASSAAPPPAPVASATPSEPTGDVVVQVTGKGATSTAPDSKKAAPLPAGSHPVVAGSTLTLPKGATATVTRGDQRARLTGAGRFVVAEPGGAFVRTDGGHVTVEQAPATVSISVPGGVIVTKAQSTADVAAKGKSGSKVAVSAGEVEVRTDKGTETLHAGEEAELGTGGAVAVAGRGPDYADLSIGAGESLAVSDPTPPTAVGIRFGEQCKHGAIVELVRGSTKIASSTGPDSANLAVPAGNYQYRVSCLTETGVSDAVAARGTLAVRRDSGTAALPRSAPLSIVDTDGRSYTVLYQNQLPNIRVRWRDAPSTGSYTLEVTGATRKVVHTSEPSHSFRSGELAEGTERLTFSGGGKSSRATTLVVRFDNAAPAAHITSPADRSFQAGASVSVSGVALPGWTVSVQGQTLEMDAQSRFSGQVVAPPHALAIRFAYPGRGVRYYLRRAAGASP